MKLGINEIKEGIYISAREKILRQLRNEGFMVFLDFPMEPYDNIRLDLFAERDTDRRIYEFKIGRNRIRKDQFALLQDYAKRLGARLYIIYLEIPSSKEIEFEGVEQIIYNDICHNPPEVLLGLATHSSISDIADIEISSISIADDIILLEGNGIIGIELQYGSRRDLIEDNGILEKADFEFSFRLKLDHNRRKILHAYYKVDTADFYD